MLLDSSYIVDLKVKMIIFILTPRSKPWWRALAIVLLVIVITLFLAISLLNQAYAFKIVTVGDLDCSHRSLQTMNSVLSYLRQNNTNRFWQIIN